MDREKKDAKYLNVHIHREVYDEFARVCEELGQSKTVAAERALKMYIEANGQKDIGGTIDE